MKTSNIYLLTLSLLLTATLTTGCRKGLADGENGASANGMTQVSFQSGALMIAQVGNSNGWESSVPHTKADPETGPEVTTPDRLPVGTTFRLVVYNAGDDPKTAEPVAQNTYKVADTEGKVLATLVDEFGTALDGSDTSAIILRRGDYDFYYFSPAIPIGKTSVATYSDLGQDIDYMALYQRQSVDPSKGRLHGVTEVNFHRMASYIDIRIAPREGEVMGTLEIDPDYGLEVFGFTNTGYYEIGGYPYYLATEGTGGMVTYSAADFGAVPDQTATISTEEVDGGHIVLPGVASDLRISGVVLSDGATKRFSTSLGTQIFEPGYRYLIELGISRVAEDPTANITVLPWNEVDWDDTNIGGKYPPVDASVTPDPTAGYIDVRGDEFTVTLTSTVMWTTPVNIRAWDDEKEEVVATGTVSYSSAQNGGSGTVTIGQNTQETLRRMRFQYEWAEQWYDIPQLAQQQGSLIDVGGTILLENPVPSQSVTWQQAADYCKNKESSTSEKWRLPTANELHFFWCITPSLSGDQLFPEDSYFWSSTKNGLGNIMTFYTSVGHINTYVLEGTVPSPTNTKFRVRCVKAAERDLTTSYPKISQSSDGQGDYIVTVAENDLGWPTAALHTQRLSESVTGDEQTTDNRLSRKFRIQNSYPSTVSIGEQTSVTWNQAIEYCNTLNSIQYHGFNNWRLPTQREIQLLFAIGASNSVEMGAKDFTENPSGTLVETKLVLNYLISYDDFLPYSPNNSWSSTPISDKYNLDVASRAWEMIFNGSRAAEIGMDKVSLGMTVRCIRDEEW